ncbi:hypothetical protein [Nonomuraea cavernae]|uniref:Uncharacterized protein n=1 Tax=Nonomuraea cavernae TaxID=2045107 RepID=A0A917Z5Z4_9ACTN|nr:hypothetical protein [Nonomuraea cavernae]MCA2188278.1 hypothetical protein [Nonomuraea cavernae]GGO73781.1 hypothetical protein GCM10012289_44910 [Nonomuraea cavernae]
MAAESGIHVYWGLLTITWNAAGPSRAGRFEHAGAFTGHRPGTVDAVRAHDGVISAAQIFQPAAR